MNPQEPIYIDILGCPRCGGTHPDLRFKPFIVPIKNTESDWTYWALCPKTGEPLVMRPEEGEE